MLLGFQVYLLFYPHLNYGGCRCNQDIAILSRNHLITDETSQIYISDEVSLL